MSTLLISFIGNRHLLLDGEHLADIAKKEKKTFRELTKELSEQYDQIKDRLSLNILDRVLEHPEYGKDITDVVLFASDQSGLDGAQIDQDTLFSGQILYDWLPNTFAPKHLNRPLRVEVIVGRGKSAVKSDDWFRLLRSYLPYFASSIEKYAHCDRWIAVDAGGTPQQKFALKTYLEYAAPIDNWLLLDVPNNPKAQVVEQQRDEYRRLITLSQIEKLIQQGHFQSAVIVFDQSFKTPTSDLVRRRVLLQWLADFVSKAPTAKPAVPNQLAGNKTLQGDLSKINAGQDSGWKYVQDVCLNHFPDMPSTELPWASNTFYLFSLRRFLVLARFYFDKGMAAEAILNLHYFIEKYLHVTLEASYPDRYPFVSDPGNHSKISQTLIGDLASGWLESSPLEAYNKARSDDQHIGLQAGNPLFWVLVSSLYPCCVPHQNVCSQIGLALSLPGQPGNQVTLSTLRNKYAHEGMQPTQDQLSQLNPSLETMLLTFEEAFSISDHRPLHQMVEITRQFLFLN